MQPLEIFLILCLGHLAADFLLQTHALVARKKRGLPSAYVHHGLIHYLAVAAIALLAAPSLFLHARFQAVALALTAVHVAVDWLKIRVARLPRISDGARLFFADQALHLATIVSATLWYAGLPPTHIWIPLRALQPHREVILMVLVIYIASVFPAGYIIRYLTRSLVGELPHVADQSSQQLQNAGLYIGWLERTVILIAMALHSPAAIGLVLTAKSIVRYQELGRSARFVEYFLIGTLLSIALAMLGGIALARVVGESAALTL